MRLITSLTTLTTTALLATALSACAANAPRRPANDDPKSSLSSFEQECYDARQRGVAEPAGCPRSTARSERRTPPGVILDRDSLPLPDLPATTLPQGGLLGR